MFEATKGNAARCKGCEHCKLIQDNFSWSFYGCFYKQYKGKWVAEIKHCPKELVIEIKE